MAWCGPVERPNFMPVAVQDYVAGYLMAYGAMVALSRRVSEGGSWAVRVSLAAVGEWIRGHGRVTEAECADCPLLLPDGALQDWLQESNSTFGVLRHLANVTRMSKTQTRWERPAVANGASPARWPARST